MALFRFSIISLFVFISVSRIFVEGFRPLSSGCYEERMRYIDFFLPKRKTNLNIFHITETRKRANNENISLVCVSISLSLHKYVGMCMYVMIFGKWIRWRTFSTEGRKTFPREIVVGKFASFFLEWLEAEVGT